MKDPRKHSEAHLAFIRKLPCLITGRMPQVAVIEAAHIRYSSFPHGKRETGKGEKPHDCWVVPLCQDKHREQHSMAEQDFWAQYQIDPLIVAPLLWVHSGNLINATAVINAAILGNFKGDYHGIDNI